MKKINPIGIAGIIVLVGFFVLFGLAFNRAHATGLTSTFYTVAVGRAYDQGWEVDSVVGLWQTYPDNDSVFRQKAVQNVAQDTHSYFFDISKGLYNQSYPLNVWALVYLNTLSYPMAWEVNPVPMQSLSVDTLRTAITSVAVVDTTAVARSVWNNAVISLANRTVTTSASGLGVFSDSVRVLRRSDSTAVGAGAVVWLRPNGGGDNYTNLTDANGFAAFSADADTFLVLFWSIGYQQEIRPDTNAVLADVHDTVWVTATTPAAQASPDLTPVTFTFFDGLGSAIKNVVLRYQLESKAATNYHLRDSSIVLDPSKVFEARSNSSGVVTIQVTPNDSILVTGGKIDQTKWRVKAYTPDGLIPLLGQDGVSLNVLASVTARVYPQSFE
jgi:hypothetical protein